jgi:signal transduction histidine kinase
MDRPIEGARTSADRGSPARAVESRLLVGVVLVAATGTFMLLTFTGPGVNHPWARLLLPVLTCVPVILLRRWPLPVLGVVTGLAVLAAASGSAWLPVGLLLGVAMYFAALSVPRPKSIELALGVGSMLAGAFLYAAFTRWPNQFASEAVESFIPLAGAWFIADAVAARRRYLAGLAWQYERERSAEVREERVRIAREMHDVVAHALAVITVQAGVGRRLADRRPEAANCALETIETISRTAQDELRVVLGLLRDGDSGGAPLAPAPTLVDVEDLVGTVRASGIPVELRMSGTDRRLSPSLELSIYRVVQEALTNVVKHAPGASAVVELAVSAGKVQLEIRDDGGPGGGAPQVFLGADHGTGQGIVGMRERIGAFGGWLVAGPRVGGGFQVSAEVPIEDVAC